MKKLLQKYSEKPANLFEKFYVNFLFGIIPVALLHIIFNLAGVIPVNFNEEKIYGLKGVLVIVLFMPFMALLFTIFIWCYFMIGNFIIRSLNKIFNKS